MAAVHPSRMGMVPASSSRPVPLPVASRGEEMQSAAAREEDRRVRDKEDRGRDERGERERGYDRDRRGGRGSPSYQPYDDRERERDRGRDAPPHMRSEGAAPSMGYGYGENRARDLAPRGGYDNGPGGAGPPPPWRGGAPPGPPGGYGDRGGYQGGAYQGGRGGYQGGGRGAMSAQESEARRVQRDQSSISVWPPSPKHAQDSDDDLGTKKRSKKSSRSKHRSSRKSSSRHKSSRHKSRRSRYSDDSSSSSDSETDSEEERRRRKRRKEKERERERGRDGSEPKEREKRSEPRGEAEDDDEWVAPEDLTPRNGDAADASKSMEVALPGQILMDDVDEVGPQLPAAVVGKDGKIDMKAYAHMRPGEGAAMAAYAASGQRIPRRGEIGLESDQIEAYEASGYVMSGSRHRRMNAVRMRKENQVISAEEKRGILKLQKEEKEKREGLIVSQFKEMISEKLAKAGQRE